MHNGCDTVQAMEGPGERRGQEIREEGGSFALCCKGQPEQREEGEDEEQDVQPQTTVNKTSARRAAEEVGRGPGCQHCSQTSSGSPQAVCVVRRTGPSQRCDAEQSIDQ